MASHSATVSFESIYLTATEQQVLFFLKEFIGSSKYPAHLLPPAPILAKQAPIPSDTDISGTSQPSCKAPFVEKVAEPAPKNSETIFEFDRRMVTSFLQKKR